MRAFRLLTSPNPGYIHTMTLASPGAVKTYRDEFPIFRHSTYLNSCSLGAISVRARAGQRVPRSLGESRRPGVVRDLVGRPHGSPDAVWAADRRAGRGDRAAPAHLGRALRGRGVARLRHPREGRRHEHGLPDDRV